MTELIRSGPSKSFDKDLSCSHDQVCSHVENVAICQRQTILYLTAVFVFEIIVSFHNSDGAKHDCVLRPQYTTTWYNAAQI